MPGWCCDWTQVTPSRGGGKAWARGSVAAAAVSSSVVGDDNIVGWVLGKG